MRFPCANVVSHHLDPLRMAERITPQQVAYKIKETNELEVV